MDYYHQHIELQGVHVKLPVIICSRILVNLSRAEGLWFHVTIVMQEDDDLSLRLSAMKVHKSRLEHEKEQASQRFVAAWLSTLGAPIARLAGA